MTGPDRRHRSTALVAILITLTLAVAGCAQTVNGHGTAANTGNGTITDGTTTNSSSQSSSTGQSTGTQTSAPPSQISCPKVVDGQSGLNYTCVVNSMKRQGNGVWPTDLGLEVDTDWTMDEGSGNYGPSNGKTLSAIDEQLAAMMLQGSYGTLPTAANKGQTETTIDGHKAHISQLLISLNPAFRKSRKLKVAQEMLWLVAIETSGGQVSGWYVSVPDVVKKYWPGVPAIIKSIKVS
ncbi:MAG: hypothetical protein ACR2KJ_14310 [Jatrophihabitans sp.]